MSASVEDIERASDDGERLLASVPPGVDRELVRLAMIVLEDAHRALTDPQDVSGHGLELTPERIDSAIEVIAQVRDRLEHGLT